MIQPIAIKPSYLEINFDITTGISKAPGTSTKSIFLNFLFFNSFFASKYNFDVISLLYVEKTIRFFFSFYNFLFINFYVITP